MDYNLPSFDKPQATQFKTGGSLPSLSGAAAKQPPSVWGTKPNYTDVNNDFNKMDLGKD
jgi:hypothetical protein